MLDGLWDLSPLTRDRTHTPYIGTIGLPGKSLDLEFLISVIEKVGQKDSLLEGVGLSPGDPAAWGREARKRLGSCPELFCRAHPVWWS